MQRVLSAVGGVLLALLAVGTVLMSIHSNHQQEQLARCGSLVVAQTVNALEAQRTTRVKLNARTQVIIRAREEAYHVMADTIMGRHGADYTTLSNAMNKYDQAVDAYSAAITDDDNAIRVVPLPDPDCLTRRR